MDKKKKITLGVVIFLCVVGLSIGLYFLLKKKSVVCDPSKYCDSSCPCPNGLKCNAKNKCEAPCTYYHCDDRCGCLPGFSCVKGLCTAPSTKCKTDDKCIKGSTCVDGACTPEICRGGKCQPQCSKEKCDIDCFCETENEVCNFAISKCGKKNCLVDGKLLCTPPCKCENPTDICGADGFCRPCNDSCDGKYCGDTTECGTDCSGCGCPSCMCPPGTKCSDWVDRCDGTCVPE